MSKVIVLLKNPKTINLKEYNDLLKIYEDKKIALNIFEDYENVIGLNDYSSFVSYFNVNDLTEFDLVTDDYDLLLAWYRIYQNQFKNYVLIYQGYSKLNFKNYNKSEQIFFSEILKLNGLSSEKCFKRIYVNMTSCNYKEIFKHFLKVIPYLTLLEKYDPLYEISNKVLNKRFFITNEESIEFEFHKGKDYIEIHLYENDFNLERILSLKEHEKGSPDLEIISLFIYYIYKSNDVQSVSNIIQYLSTNNQKAHFERLMEFILKNIHIISDCLFIDKINFMFILNSFSDKKDIIGDAIFNLVENDNTQIQYHQNIIKNLNILVFRNIIPAADHYPRITRKAMEKVARYYDSSFNQIKGQNHFGKSDKLVIIIDQLLAEHHAPTKVLLTTCELLLKNTACEILIIVEENMVPSQEEKFHTEFFVANNSFPYKELHKKYFSSDRIELFYSNIESSKKTRLRKLSNKVKEYQPEAVISFSGYSIFQNWIYGKIPIVYVSFGAEYSPGVADLYLYKNEKKAIVLEKKFGSKELDKIKSFIYDINFLESKKIYTRNDLGFTENEFVVITVGNRINTEIQPELIDEMIALLNKYNDIKWLLVGDTIPLRIKEKYSEFIGANIIHLPFEEDLLALTKKCDVFLNPNRVGGGYAVAASMKVGVPVLTTNFDSDGLVFVGRENAVGEKYSDLMNEMEKMYLNPIYKKEKGRILKERIMGMENEKNILKLLDFIEEAKVNFKKKFKG